MGDKATFTRIQFRNFKAFSSFSVSLRDFNILVGPNNSGKSTILNAFRVLAAGIRRASARTAIGVQGPDGRAVGHEVPTEDIPISFENVHTNYDRSEGASIVFTLSNKNTLTLFFEMPGKCVLIPNAHSRPVRSPSAFQKEFPVSIYVVPVLGPLENEEILVEAKTVRRNLATHRASRHFRNYWFYYPEEFQEFAEMLKDTWPGMEVKEPERMSLNRLVMFCVEDDILRELYWAGFGFQVWCQLLTHVVRGRSATLFAVDEPEIYLHPDLQRQLLAIMRTNSSTVLLATHSPEIISEAEPEDILVVDKSTRSARRLKTTSHVQTALDLLGSNQNITLAKLARTNKILFVEGSDFKLFSQFARVLALHKAANQSDFAVVPTEGFTHWPRIESLRWGIEELTGQSPLMGAVFDRDFRCDDEIEDIRAKLATALHFVHFHQRKELENYLLVPVALERAIKTRIPAEDNTTISIETILYEITDPLRNELMSQYIGARLSYFGKTSKDKSTVSREAMEVFDAKWSDLNTRMEIVSGKDLFSSLNRYLQEHYGTSLTPAAVVRAHSKYSVPKDLVSFLRQVEKTLCNT